MNTRKIFPKLMAALLCAMLLVGTAPLPAMAVGDGIDITHLFDDPYDTNTYIDPGGAWTFDAAIGVFTITGDVTIVNDGNIETIPALVINIKNGSTVTWSANCTGESGGDAGFVLVDVSGNGKFIIGDVDDLDEYGVVNGSIILNGGGTAVQAESGVAVTVDGSVFSNDDNSTPVGCTGINAGGDVSVLEGGNVSVSSPQSVDEFGNSKYIPTAPGSIMAIWAGGDVSVSGTVDATSTFNGTAIYAVGNVIVCGDYGWVGANCVNYYGVAIRSDGASITVEDSSYVFGHSAIVAKNASVTVYGDSYVYAKGYLAYTDSELFGNAIMANVVTVEGNARVQAQNGAAIFYSGTCNITGGAVFAWGDGIGGAGFEISADDIAADPAVPYMLNVIFKTPDLHIAADTVYSDIGSAEARVIDDGLALAWDCRGYYDALDAEEYAGYYTSDEKDDISASFAGTADYWWVVNTKTHIAAGIGYETATANNTFPITFQMAAKPVKYNPQGDDSVPDDNNTPGPSNPGSSYGGSASSNSSGSFSGGGSAYTQGSAGGVVYTVQKDFSLFSGVKVGSNTLTKNKDYKAEKGSTIITLLPSYLDTLSAGTYTLTVIFTDGASSSAQFTVAAGPKLPFTDVASGAWYFSAVNHVYTSGLMIGTAADTFAPNLDLSRAMIVTILYRNAGSPGASGFANPFSDVPGGTWYTDAVKWAAANGVVNGYGDGRFGPDDPVSKEQLAALIYRTQQSSGKIPPDINESKTFSDASKISDWAKAAVGALNNQGVFRDIPGGGFNPQTSATRAEVASMLYLWLTSAM